MTQISKHSQGERLEPGPGPARVGDSPGACCDLDAVLHPDLFRALSDPNRLALLSRLAMSSEPRTVSELNACCPVDLSVVSRHLAILRDAGVVEADKRGREVFYTICCRPLAASLRSVADALESCAANRRSPQVGPQVGQEVSQEVSS